MIRQVKLRLLGLPLKEPYKLAFGAVGRFDTLLVQVEMRGRVGLGEATVLTGYTTETVEGSWSRALAAARRIIGLDSVAAKATIAADLADAPFTATALTTAIEMAGEHSALQPGGAAAVPLLAGINATDREGIAAEIERALAAGFRTLKLKVGFDVESDVDRVGFIEAQNDGRARLRIDANQGYDRRDACRFAAAIDGRHVELLEQPCHADDWDSLAAVAKSSPLPLMLDESIYSEADIERAADLGARYVKLKLMKFVSLDRLARGLELICECGMEPVLGNGVAGDIGCWMEACIAARHIRNAGEMNGFLRQAAPLARPPMRVENGALILPVGAPRLDEAGLDRVTVRRAAFGETAASAEGVS